MILIHYLRNVIFAAVCLAASPAAPVPSRSAVEVERLPHFDDTGALPSQSEFEKLATTDAIAALKASITRGQREVRGYRATFLKQERIGGKAHPPEEIAVSFREEPFATLMLWRKGSRLFAEGTLYAVGENDGKMLVWLPSVFNRISKVGTRDAIARSSARYAIEDFGITLSSQRTLKSWGAMRDRGELDVEYLGLQAVPEMDGKKCYAIRRTCRTEHIDPFLLGEPPEPVTEKNRGDAFKTVTIYLDPETWLQLGTLQQRADGERVGAYFFKDLVLNPAFAKDEFKPAAFRK